MSTAIHPPLAESNRSAGRAAGPHVIPTVGIVRRIASRVWLALEDIGRARAQIALRDLANRYEGHDPALAAQLRAASSFHHR